ncbi:MAG: HAD-IB family hydrolase [Sphingomonadaceae bacterium]
MTDAAARKMSPLVKVGDEDGSNRDGRVRGRRGPQASARQVRLSIFDLDRTLTRRPTYSLFLLKTAWRHSPWRLCLLPLLAPYATAYFLKLLPRTKMKEAMHRVMLGPQLDGKRLRLFAETFVREVASNGLYPDALQRIQEEVAAGRRVIIATAAPAFYAKPLAKLLGIKDVVASQPTWKDGWLLPEICGGNCHGPEKQRRVEAFLRHAGIERQHAHIRFFSDDVSDLPTFEWADEAIAVNPCSGLASVARQRKWTVLDWRISHTVAA